MEGFTASLCAISAVSSLTVRLKRSNRRNLEAGGENYYPAKGAVPISNLLLLKAEHTRQPLPYPLLLRLTKLVPRLWPKLRSKLLLSAMRLPNLSHLLISM